jgi:nucleotide-binding universal stress UspA family protein
MPQFNKILCPVDFDPNSLLALRLASEMAQERKATLYLLHVVGDASRTGGGATLR